MLLSVENVTFRYPKASADALREVSLTVDDGEWAIVCGLSGCGKSTLLRLIKRELAPYGDFRGAVRFEGTDISPRSSSAEAEQATKTAGTKALRNADPALARRCAEGIGLVLQDPEAQIVTDTVWHELAFGLENLGLPSDTIRRRVAEMASFFGIESWYHRHTYELSGGQKQLLNLASALVMNPRLLLLDEPTAQLDPIAAADFRNVLQRVNRDLGVAILMAEHRLEDVLTCADRIFLMDDASVCFRGTPAELVSYMGAREHPMTAALPAAARIALALTGHSSENAPFIPLTVRDGRSTLRAHLTDMEAASDDPAAAENASAGTDAPESPSEAVLVAKDVRFRYERNLPDVLSGATLSLHAGEHYCLLGGNGSGKTTLLSLLAGLTAPYAGTVRLFGKKLSSYAPGTLYRGNIALLPQQPRDVFTEKTIREDLQGAFRRIAGDGTDADAAAEASMERLCERFRISKILDSHPYDVSGGEIQKAALVKVLAANPKVLLLDEPIKGIDVRGRAELADLLAELRGEGLAVLSVTHDAEWAAEHATRCGLLFDGEVISEDTPKAFFDANAFYTTAANRIARGLLPGAVTCDDVIDAYRRLRFRGENDPGEVSS